MEEVFHDTPCAKEAIMKYTITIMELIAATTGPALQGKTFTNKNGDLVYINRPKNIKHDIKVIVDGGNEHEDL